VTPFTGPTSNDAADLAAQLATVRRVLVTGLSAAPADVIVAACDLAEALGAAIDAGDNEMARPVGPTIARVGEVTADREELRDRADLVLFWFCDPPAADATFIERYVAPPLVSARQRRTVAVGPHALPDTHVQVCLARGTVVDAARVLWHLLVHGREAAIEEEPLAVPLAPVARAVEQASCVAVVTDHAADPLGLEPWSVVHLVRTIAHRKPAFEIPLDGPASNRTSAVLTWRYGAAGAIAKADRSGGQFLPGEASAVRLIERGEVDCVVVVGRVGPAVERALAAASGHVSRIRLDDADPGCVKARLESILASIRVAIAGGGMRP
jgi:formylmethanofuran dehydrogenase subunit B